MGTHILILGNPIDGFEFYGTFATADEAIEFAEKHIAVEWHVAPLRLHREMAQMKGSR